MSNGMQKTKNRRHCTYLSLSEEEYLMELWWWGEEWTPDVEYWKKGGGGILSSMSPNNKDTKNSKENSKIESSGQELGGKIELNTGCQEPPKKESRNQEEDTACSYQSKWMGVDVCGLLYGIQGNLKGQKGANNQGASIGMDGIIYMCVHK